MIYGFSLQTMGVVVGAFLVVVHLVALAKPEPVKLWLQRFPRSRPAGLVLLVLAAVWGFYLIATIDMGEFSNLRRLILILIPAGAVATAYLVEEFLSVRSLGMLALLATEPLLESAFLRPETSRLLLVLVAYAWAVAGIFWVGLPYLLRDQIGWATRSSLRWRTLATLGLAYGAILHITAWFW